MSSAIAAVIIFLWVFALKKWGCSGALSFLLCVATIFFGSIANIDNGNRVDVVVKFLFLITILLQIKKRFRVNGILVMILLLLVFAFVNAHFALFNRTYSPQDCFAAYVTLYTGFFVCLCSFTQYDIKRLLFSLSVLPSVSLGLGAILASAGLLPFLGRFGTAIAGASLSTNLAFFGTIGVAAALAYFKCFGNVRLRYLAYFNFLVTCSTLTRGGILASAIILLYDLIPFARFALKHYKTLTLVVLGVGASIPAAVYAISAIVARTTAYGDSGRADAWAYILSMQRNFYFGNGYGFLKARDDYELMSFTAAHNEYVHLYVEIGFVGLVLVALFYLFFVKKVFKMSALPKIFVCEVILAFLLYSYTDNTITNYRFWFPYMLLLSVFLNCNHYKFSLGSEYFLKGNV